MKESHTADCLNSQFFQRNESLNHNLTHTSTLDMSRPRQGILLGQVITFTGEVSSSISA